MKNLLLTPLFLIGFLPVVSAQGNCPDDQLITIPETQDTVTAALLNGNLNNCPADSMVFTIGGASSTWGVITDNEVLLNAGLNEVTYYNCANIQQKILTDPVPLPDGNGVEYSIPFIVDGYPEGSTVEGAGQPIVICATMEHSYLGDLDIWVACPDGTQWMLHEYNVNDNVRRQLLGRGDQNTSSPDPSYQYCWRVGAPLTFAAYVDENNIGSNQSLPAGDYAPTDSLSVIGECLVNGEWSLNFRDNLTVDNGSVAAWSVAFESPKTEKCSYTIEVKKRPVSITGPANLPGFRLMVTPNPFAGTLTVNTWADATDVATLGVYTISGQEVLQQTISLAQGEQQLSFAAEAWPAGIYFLRVRTEAGEIVRKIVRR